jgi:hypothetical protein
MECPRPDVARSECGTFRSAIPNLAAEKSAGPLIPEFSKFPQGIPIRRKKRLLAKATELRPIAPQMTTTSECRYRWLRLRDLSLWRANLRNWAGQAYLLLWNTIRWTEAVATVLPENAATLAAGWLHSLQTISMTQRAILDLILTTVKVIRQPG